jgi:hypothetical protein
MLSSMDTESALWIATRAGRRDLIRSRLDVRCEPRASDGAVCAVFDGATTRYWRVGANVEPLLVVQLAAADRRIVALTYGTLRVYEISGS